MLSTYLKRVGMLDILRTTDCLMPMGFVTHGAVTVGEEEEVPDGVGDEGAGSVSPQPRAMSSSSFYDTIFYSCRGGP